MPLDIEPADDGNIILSDSENPDGPMATVLTNLDLGQEWAQRVQKFKSHFATCPATAQHRRRAR